MDLGETGWGEWIQLAQYTDQWWGVVNVVMNLCVLAPRISRWLSFCFKMVTAEHAELNDHECSVGADPERHMPDKSWTK
jgi:hypothetical protein